MSQTLLIANFGQLNIRELSKLGADLAVAATSVQCKFSDDLATNDYVYIGRLGSESSEVVTIATVTDSQNIVIDSPGATKPHKQYDDMTVLFGNKIQVYRAANVDGTPPADSAYSTLGSPVDIDFDQVQTTYTDATGGSDYWYKFTFVNSGSATATALADSSAARGGTIGNYCTIEDARGEAGLTGNRYITDAMIDDKRQAAQSIINSELVGVYDLPFTAPINPLIKLITKQLAAGYLLIDDYGPVTTLDTKNGQQKIDAAMAMLAKLKSKEQELIGVDGTGLALTGSGGMTAWPNSTTADTLSEDGGGKRGFRIGMRY